MPPRRRRARAPSRASAPLRPSRNKVAKRLAELKCDPIAGMAALAMDPDTPAALRGRLYSELAQYVAPKRRAVEHKGEVAARSHEEWLNQLPE